LIEHSQAVVGMRLHSLIFSTIAQTPFLALSYSSKVRNFAREAGMEDYTLDWATLELPSLKANFERLMENQNHVRANLTEKYLLMRERAMEHREILRDFFGLH
jgi:polysaccharide pyruvyl transferase WcaK-like protein